MTAEVGQILRRILEEGAPNEPCPEPVGDVVHALQTKGNDQPHSKEQLLLRHVWKPTAAL